MLLARWLFVELGFIVAVSVLIDTCCFDRCWAASRSNRPRFWAEPPIADLDSVPFDHDRSIFR